MSTQTQPEPTQQFLFGPIIAALLFVGLAALLVWATQVRPVMTPQTDAVEAEVASQGGAMEGDAGGAPVHTSTGDPTHGQQLFAGTCSACHGLQGQGIAGLGKDVTQSQFVEGQADEQLVEFLKIGRGPTDPLNTTGIAMPPKGGNPALSDEDLYDIIAYIRTIHK